MVLAVAAGVTTRLRLMTNPYIVGYRWTFFTSGEDDSSIPIFQQS